jgi:copper homeostasis protein
LPRALEDVIATGCDRVLSSGGQCDVLAGAETLAKLVVQADHRIAVAIGGGLHLEDAASQARKTGAVHFHGSLRRRLNARTSKEDVDKSARFGAHDVVFADDIRSMIHRLQNA